MQLYFNKIENESFFGRYNFSKKLNPHLYEKHSRTQSKNVLRSLDFVNY